ncbi:hypothetical protein PS918_03139 [Pseudomonas fluorescens]|uniref:Bro-N domain-containing protein n=1 Tax=Pseudomonas fluorescens TaxID=294 RepID=A0A5E7SVY0_PSEFL|nr:Bro-N domain-containing protein [Pseudomonas fluorescens]VVP89988.1 hypothetical protein PS918_03139 [Pseudomonas fluorescens]
MAGNAEQAGGSLKTKKPQCGNTEASGNEINFGEEIVMSNNSTAASSVIPFNFGKQQVRTLLISDQPWFVAGDVSLALEYRDSFNMCRNLDDDEKGTQIVSTPGGEQEMLVINESGLYSAILRSRKAEAKRFKKWITAEVLPAIRKHGRYEDQGKMAALMDQLSLSQFNTIKGVIRDKIKAAPAEKRQGLQLVMHNRLHTRFNVPRTELIPASQFDSACNFIAAYSIEGEYLGKETAAPMLPLNIHFPVDCLTDRREGMRKPRDEKHDYLGVVLSDLAENFTSPCEKILSELSRAGYSVEGAWWEFRTYRNKTEQLLGMIRGLQEVAVAPQSYVIGRRVSA